MTEEILFSVIIPVYNAGAYIEKCLESVLQNRKVSFEIVVANDGSTDHTAEICKKWADRHHNIVYLEQIHQGQGSARNLAVNHASGKWLVFLDADDEWMPGALEYLGKNVSEDIDICWYSSILVRQDRTEYLRQVPSSAKEKKKIMQGMSTELWDKAFRTAFWREEGIRLSDYYGEDIYAVYMLAAKASEFRTLPAPLVRHYDRADNLTSKPERVIEVVQSIAYVLRAFQERRLLETYRLPLLFMLSAQHKVHAYQWKTIRREESGRVLEELEKLAMQYFPEESQAIFRVEKESIVVIGKSYDEISEALLARDVYCYECMEQFLLDEYKITDSVCHFIVDVETEALPVIRQTKNPRWAIFYWETQCKEVLNIRKRNRLKGRILLYHDAAKSREVIEDFERTAQKAWQCEKAETPDEIWDKLLSREDITIEKNDDLGNGFTEFNYRWECMRLEQNSSLMCSWIRLRQCGVCLKRYFQQHGYHNIGIYGVGYLGRLLLGELKSSSIQVLFLVDRDYRQNMGYPLFSPEEVLPAADAVVVSVIHQYRYIRSQIKCACKVISLQEVIDWCIGMCGI